MNIAPQEIWLGPPERRVNLTFREGPAGLIIEVFVGGLNGTTGILYFDADGVRITDTTAAPVPESPTP